MTDQTRVDYDWRSIVDAFEQDEEEIEYDFSSKQFMRDADELRGDYDS